VGSISNQHLGGENTKNKKIKEFNIEGRLKKLAEQNKVPYETIKSEWEVECKALNEKGLKGDLSKLACHAVANNYRRKKQFQQKKDDSTREALYGFVIGDSGIFDKAQQIRNEAKRYIDEHGVQAAKEAQLINEDGEILDQRPTIFGRVNPKHLEPLDPNLKVRNRTLYGIFRKNGSKTFKLTSIQTADNKLALAWNKVKLFTPCQTVAIIKEELKTEVKANSSQMEGSSTIFKAVKEDMAVDSIVLDTLGPMVSPIKDLEEHHKTFADAWDRKIVLKGIVAWLNVDRPTSFGSIYMGLMDPEDEESLVRVLIPEHLPITFGELSEVIVLGKTRRSKYKDKESGKLVEGDVIVDVYAVYALPGLSTPKEGRGEETDDQEVEGWID